jgi:hypothetical protein
MSRVQSGHRTYGIAISGLPGKTLVIWFSLSIFRLICTVDSATSVEQLVIKLIIAPSSLRDLTVQVATFPLIWFPSIMKPLPYMSESRVIEMVLSFFSKILLQIDTSLAQAPFRSAAFTAGLTKKAAIKSATPRFTFDAFID